MSVVEFTPEQLVDRASYLPRPRGDLTAARVIEVCARRFGVKPEQITGKLRHKGIALARHVAMYIARHSLHRSDASYPQLGKAFANRDHTTVLAAVRKVKRVAERDRFLSEKLGAIFSELAG